MRLPQLFIQTDGRLDLLTFEIGLDELELLPQPLILPWPFFKLGTVLEEETIQKFHGLIMYQLREFFGFEVDLVRSVSLEPTEVGLGSGRVE